MMSEYKRYPACVDLLTEEQVEQIHEVSIEILENVGLEVLNQKAREVFIKHDCDVASKSLNVKIPRRIIKEFMAAVPSKFTFFGRDPQYDRTVPEDGPLFTTTGSTTNVVDIETQKIRLSTTKDIAQLSHLINKMPGFDLCTISLYPTNVSGENYFLSRIYHALKNCLKPIRGGNVGSVKEAEKILKLCTLIAGSEEAFYRRPFLSFPCCNIISPLKMDYDSTELLMWYVEKKVPVHSYVVPNAGLSSPLSLTGTLVQANAEFLASTVLMQMIRPQTPVLYYALPTVADMRTGAYASGGIETAILFMGCNQMARFYDVCSGGCIGQTNSKIADAQAGFERAISSMGGVLAGMDILNMGGLIDGLMLFDYGMLVIDNEIAQMLKRVKRGYEFSKDDLKSDFDVIREVGAGGNFLETKHTLERMRKVPYFPEIADRSSRSKWEKEGGLDAYGRAIIKAREILKTNNQATFSRSVDAKISAEFENLVHC